MVVRSTSDKMPAATSSAESRKHSQRCRQFVEQETTFSAERSLLRLLFSHPRTEFPFGMCSDQSAPHPPTAAAESRCCYDHPN